jgi:hypothetical protein
VIERVRLKRDGENEIHAGENISKPSIALGGLGRSRAAMSRTIKKLRPALKHGGFSATGLLPGEDRAAFEKLYQDLAEELRLDGPLETDIVDNITRLTWRKQNLHSFQIAKAARERFNTIRAKMIPSTDPPLVPSPVLIVHSELVPDPDWEPPDPEELEAAKKAADTQARKELGVSYGFIELGTSATVPHMLEHFGTEARLSEMINALLKQLLFLRGVKSTIGSSSPPAGQLRLVGPKKTL